MVVGSFGDTFGKRTSVQERQDGPVPCLVPSAKSSLMGGRDGIETEHFSPEILTSQRFEIFNDYEHGSRDRSVIASLMRNAEWIYDELLKDLTALGSEELRGKSLSWLGSNDPFVSPEEAVVAEADMREGWIWISELVVVKLNISIWQTGNKALHHATGPPVYELHTWIPSLITLHG